MARTRFCIYNDLFHLSFLGERYSARFTAIVLIAIFGMFTLTFFRPAAGQESSGTCSSGPLTCTSGIITTLHLNLTRANVNASRNFQESSWSSNNTLAQITVNSSDQQGGAVAAVLQLDQSYLQQAQIIRYNFNFSTLVPTPGPYGPRITASVGLTSSHSTGWYARDQSPVYSNNTKTISVTNIEGLYPNSSFRSSLLFEAQQVTNQTTDSPAERSTTLFQREYAGYAAGDGHPHRYSIEMDLQSNRTIWIIDDAIIATYRISFVPSDITFIASASDPGNLATASLQDLFQTTISRLQASNTLFDFAAAKSTIAGLQQQITILNGQSDQVSSLQDQVARLGDQVDNLANQNSQLQAKNSQWFSQWWFSIISGLLGAGFGGLLFLAAPKLKMRRETRDLTGRRGNMACLQCGSQMPVEATFCGECGTVLRETKLLCPQCGAQMPTSSVYCGVCGAQIAEEALPSQNTHFSSEVDFRKPK